MGLRSSEALLLSTMHPAFARADSSEIPNCRTYVLSLVRISGATFPKATLSQSYWLQRTRSAGLRDSLAAFLQSAQGMSKTKATTPEFELAQKESEYNKASAHERLLEKKLQKSTETFENLRKQLQSEQDMLGKLGPALSQAKETTEQSLDEPRVMRIAVHGAGADGDKNAPRPSPMEQDTDIQTKDLVAQ